jgi:hypothetical protein
MTKFLLFLTSLTISNIIHSQTKALTENGQEVILFENGTWKYLNADSNNTRNSSDTLNLNQNKFHKPTSSTFLVKSKILNVGVFINPTQWTFSGRRDNETNPEYRFSLKNGEGYAMMITEKLQIDLEALRKIALINAQNASLDVKETFAEYRMVNNLKVLCLKLEGTLKGVKFTYFGYYYSNPNGTVQLVSYSSQKLFEGIKKELDSFLNGFIEIEN